MKNYIGLVILVSALSTSCAKQLQDYVRDGGATPTAASSDNPVGMRITPGANTSSGTTVKSQFAITTMNRPVTGTHVKATISFHQTRPE